MYGKKNVSILLSFFLIVSILIPCNGFVYAADSDYLGQYNKSTNFGIANDFNVFVFGNLNQSNVDSEGRIAVGGNATLSSFGIGSRLSLSTTRADLIVAGEINATNGSNSSGNTVLGPNGRVVAYSMNHTNGVPNQPIRADIIDFASARSQLINTSKSWSNININGSHRVDYGTQLTLEGNNPNLNVFKLNANNIDGKGFSFNSINQINIKAPANSTVLINVGGDNIGFGSYSIFFNGNSATSSAGQYFVWNFYEANTLWNENLSIKGSVLAPYANWVSKGNGNLEGTLIANSLSDGPNSSHLETHNYLFKGYISSSISSSAPIATATKVPIPTAKASLAPTPTPDTSASIEPIGAVKQTINSPTSIPTNTPIKNSLPVVDNYTFSTKEDTPITNKVIGFDIDGDELLYSKASDPSNGIVSVNSAGSWTYTPDDDYIGTDNFKVEVSDGNGGKDISIITVSITPVNDPPSAPNATEGTEINTPVSGQVDGTDIDGDKITYSKLTDPEYGKVIVNTDGTWTYTPNNDFTGTDTFKVGISDDNGSKSSVIVTINVVTENTSPTIPDYTVSTNEDTPVKSKVVGNDPDEDTLEYSTSTDPENGVAKVNPDGTWMYTPNENYTGKDTFKVEVNDGKGKKAESTVTINIVPVNDTPFAPDSSFTTKLDTPVSDKVTASDPDGDKLTYALDTKPSDGSVEVNSDGTWTYTPNDSFIGSDSFTVKVDDGNDTSDISKVTILVAGDNPPTVPDYKITTVQNQPFSGKVVGKVGTVGDKLKYSKSTDPIFGTVEVKETGEYTYIPNNGFTGIDTFKIIVDDQKGGLALSKITITINPDKELLQAKDTKSNSIVEPKSSLPKGTKNSMDLAVMINSSTMRIAANGTVKYSITYFNKLNKEVDNVYLKVNIPNGMLFEEATNEGEKAGRYITWNLGSVPAEFKKDVSFILKANELDDNEFIAKITASIYTDDSSVQLINTEDDQSSIQTMIFNNLSAHSHSRYIMGYPDGNVKPKGMITRAEVAAIFARILNLKDNVTGKSIYSDVSTKFWAAEYIEAVSEYGLFTGYNNKFRPNDPITRAELSTVIAKYLNVSKNSSYKVLVHHFRDLSGHWAEANIEEIYRFNVTLGYNDGTFLPNKKITREEGIKMVNQMLFRGPLTNVKSSFPDNLEKNWSFGHIEEATRSHESEYNTNGSEKLLKFIQQDLW